MNSFSVETEDVPTMNKASERRAHEFEKALPKSEGVEAAEHLSKVSMSTSEQNSIVFIPPLSGADEGMEFTRSLIGL
jgi:hypothetical protein